MAQVVGGRYRLIAHLGGGTFADVSLAKTDAKSDVAKLSVVKRLKLGADAEPEVVTRFVEEARLCVRLNHPNIAQAFEVGEDAEGPFLVLEYLEGQTVGRIRSRARRRAAGVPRPIALHIVMAMATGLAYAHALQDQAGKPLKIVHRNVTPENVIVTYAGTTKLVDFSVAMPAPTPASASRVGTPKGDVAYMAPEQAKSAVNLDARADVFATGLILWELLASKRMWEGLSEAEVLARLADDQPLPALRSVVPDMPAALDAICAQALSKVRDDRFDSAAELREALEKVASAPELRTTTREVAEFVTSLFEDEREKMRALVDDALLGAEAPAKGLPRVGPARPPTANAFVDVETDPNLWAAAAPRATAPAAPTSAPSAPSRVVEVLRVEQGPSRDRRFALLVGGAVLIAFAVVAVVAIKNDGKDANKDDTKPFVFPTSRPTASAAADPASSALVEPEEVTIEITVKPLTAKLFVDGIRTPSNPHRVKVVRGKFAHQLRAEADGLETRSMSVVFDRDRSIDIALTPKPFVGGPPPRLPASASASASAEPRPPGKDRDAQ